MDSFDRYVDEQSSRFVDELRRLCQQPSISAQGLGIPETADLVTGLLRHASIDARILVAPGGAPVVYGQVGKGSPTVLVYDHYDVQPVDPVDLWDSDPFGADLRDGRIYARGVSDNKGPLMARIQAIEAWQKTLGPLPLTVKFVVEGEEEIGSPHLSDFVKTYQSLLDADVCIWEGGGMDPAGRPIVYLGVKGMAYFELRARRAASDVQSSWATLVPNPAWRLIWALASLKDAEERITVDGLMEHVAEPTTQDWDLLRSIPFEEDAVRGGFGIPSFLGGLTGLEALKKHLFEPTCTVCGFGAGYQGEGTKTVMPNTAMTKIDFRLVPNLTPALVEELLRAHLDRRGFSDIEISRVAELYPSRSPVDHPIVRRILQTVHAFYERKPVVYPTIAGSGPMYQLCERLGIPGVLCGGVSHYLSNVHAPNENIFLADYLAAVRFNGRLLADLSQMPIGR